MDKAKRPPRERKGLKKGDKIKCGSCKEEIYTAAVDIPFGAPMRSSNLLLENGETVDYGSQTICPKCGAGYISISTQLGETF